MKKQICGMGICVALCVFGAEKATWAQGDKPDLRLTELEKECLKLNEISDQNHLLITGIVTETSWSSPPEDFVVPGKDCSPHLAGCGSKTLSDTYHIVLSNANMDKKSKVINVSTAARNEEDLKYLALETGKKYGFCGSINEYNHPSAPPSYNIRYPETIKLLD